MQPLATPDKILDAAERLFAEEGIEGVSLRRIIAAAGVNIAAVHYHFGSKDELARAVLRRRLRPLNAERLRQIEELRVRHGERAIPVEELMRAFLAPVIELAHSPSGEGLEFFRFIARAHAGTNEALQEELFAELKDVISACLAELKRAVPDVPDGERAMRLAFCAGAMVQAILLPLKPMFIESFFGKALEPEELLEMLVQFTQAGMKSVGSEQGGRA